MPMRAPSRTQRVHSKVLFDPQASGQLFEDEASKSTQLIEVLPDEPSASSNSISIG
jgi:hypothetical protein